MKNKGKERKKKGHHLCAMSQPSRPTTQRDAQGWAGNVVTSLREELMKN